MENKTIEILLKEQHRNTRHDSIEIINSYLQQLSKESPNLRLVFEGIEKELSKDIMNLKQRQPDLT